jgi:putative ABC transport system ATP-binding protein
MTDVLQAESLAKTYRASGVDVHALRGVDLSVADGEFVAIMGPSGCGKSTMLHLLAGLDRPTSGSVHLAGRRVDGFGEARWAVVRRAEIGFVFQFFNLIANLSVADNVELPALLAGCSAGEARRRGSALLDDLGIADKARAVPGQLSGGQQQRVALARALVNRPAVLLADEPTGNLDSTSAREVVELLRVQHERGQSILLVTHDPRVASAADRIVYLRDGRVVDEARMAPGRDPASVVTRLLELEA